MLSINAGLQQSGLFSILGQLCRFDKLRMKTSHLNGACFGVFVQAFSQVRVFHAEPLDVVLLQKTKV